MKKNSFTTRLYQHYITPPELVFPQFKLGAVIFLCGLIIIYIAHQTLPPSLTQEIITLIGLLCIGGGLLTALMAQARMLIGRLLRFFVNK